MNSKERTSLMNQGIKLDRLPFMPTVFEHSARFLWRTPSETAIDEKLMAEAHVKAYKTYRHDVVNVGIDLYNIEAEALGCELRFHDDCSVPGILSHPFAEYIDYECIKFSQKKGRIGKILNAATDVKAQIGYEVNVGVGICGPFSISVELRGYENIIMDCLADGRETHWLLKACLEFQMKYCDEIVKRGLGITVFESWANPLLVSPDVYREFVRPYEKKLINYIKTLGLSTVPLVIGGDTSLIVDDIISTDTTLLVADYCVDLEEYICKASKKGLAVRGNIDPKMVEKGSKDEIIDCLKAMVEKVKGYDKFIVGTCVIPYGTPAENVLAIRSYLEG